MSNRIHPGALCLESWNPAIYGPPICVVTCSKPLLKARLFHIDPGANKSMHIERLYSASPSITLTTPRDIGLRRYLNGPKATNSFGNSRSSDLRVPRVLRMPPHIKTTSGPRVPASSRFGCARRVISAPTHATSGLNKVVGMPNARCAASNGSAIPLQLVVAATNPSFLSAFDRWR